MTRHTNVKVRIAEGQTDKLKKACESNYESIAISLTSTDHNGVNTLLPSQNHILVD